MKSKYIRKIYFKGAENEKTLEDLIKKIYKNLHFPITYSNKALTTIQCRSGAARSFGDLRRLALTYFPNSTEQELAKIIYQLNKEQGLFPTFCLTVRKMVFNRGQSYIKKRMEDYMHFYKDKVGADKYSFNMIKKFANADS
jgi:hypothetical protein